MVPYRVGLVDDHPVVLDSLARAISGCPDLDLIGQAGTLADATAMLAGGTTFDVVVCDIQMGGEAAGLRLLERFAGKGKPAFLILSSYDYPALFRTAFEQGADGYLLKTVSVDEIIDAVRTVAAGRTAFSAAFMRTVRSALRRPSERELEVLRLVTRGASNDEIAQSLVLSLKTIESHIRRMFDRYGVMNRTELAVLAVREGWITPA